MEEKQWAEEVRELCRIMVELEGIPKIYATASKRIQWGPTLMQKTPGEHVNEVLDAYGGNAQRAAGELNRRSILGFDLTRVVESVPHIFATKKGK
jgi:hypothetical protein